MKHSISLLLMVFALSGCSTYYYSYVNSYDDTLVQAEDGSFINEGSDVVVSYSFSEYNGGFVYQIENRSNDPISVDWNKSAVSMEDKVYQDANRGKISGSMSSQNLAYSSTGSFSGKVELPNERLFIPPGEKTSYTPVSVSQFFNLDAIPKSSFQKGYIGVSIVRRAQFTKEDSPLVFRSYLTIVNEKDHTERVIEDEFYISGVTKSKERTLGLVSTSRNQKNIFYILK
ncbi:MAG: hypothetical protein WC403_05495 [Proteiniphilum sp.]|nr:hypothetical protein [Proteiniphilum sp.]MDD5345973.1 hypothetical protein [Proteiniphilum sp.]MDY0183609.1 hypothetical protein [Proteiniphilum sp.]